jgi:hypothetical protein
MIESAAYTPEAALVESRVNRKEPKRPPPGDGTVKQGWMERAQDTTQHGMLADDRNNQTHAC